MEEHYFGAMLDCSRNGVMRPEQVKRFASILRRFGYNALLLYTEDTYEIEGEPFFGYMRGRYSIAELQDIDDYCASIGVELIPCIQVLAHLRQIFRWPPYRDIHDIDDIMLVDEKKSEELIEKMIRSCRKAFRSHHIQLGMDEAGHLGRGKHQDLFGAEGASDILLRHINRVTEIAARYDFKPLMWADMFYKLANHGYYFGHNIVFRQDVRDKLPKEMHLVYWDYYQTDGKMYTDMMKSGKTLDPELWYAGGAWTWMGFVPQNRFSLKTQRLAMKAAREQDIHNVLITCWGDDGAECNFFSVLPTLFACRKFYEGETNMGKIAEEFQQITGESFHAFLHLDDPNLIAHSPICAANPSRWALYNDPFLRLLDTRVQPEGAADYKKVTRRLHYYAKHTAYPKLFDMEAKLSDFLSIKYDLGVRTKKAYDEGKEAVSAILPDYRLAQKKLKIFFEAYRDLWLEENKPFGWEVQAQRIGGVLLRLKDCEDRLSDFAAGKIDRIDELDAKVHDLDEGTPGEHKKTGTFQNWRDTVTASVI